jgi:septal ring factor EnvC (AmiA/AmiB activator)
LIEKNADVLTQVQPCLIDDYKMLKEHISEQRDENEALYKQLLSLKKDTTSTAQKIAMFRSRIERLERTIGVQP